MHTKASQTPECPPPAAEVHAQPTQTLLFDKYTLFTTKPFKGFAGRFRQLVIQDVGARKEQVKKFVEKLRDRMNECDFKLYSRPEAFFPSVPPSVRNSFAHIILNDGILDMSDLDQTDTNTWVWYALGNDQFATEAAYMHMSSDRHVPELSDHPEPKTKSVTVGDPIISSHDWSPMMGFTCTLFSLKTIMMNAPKDTRVFWVTGHGLRLVFTKGHADVIVENVALVQALSHIKKPLVFCASKNTMELPAMRNALACMIADLVTMHSIFPLYSYHVNGIKLNNAKRYTAPASAVVVGEDGNWKVCLPGRDLNERGELYACSQCELEEK